MLGIFILFGLAFSQDVIKVAAGTDFNIDLEETPSTGFTWTFYDDSFTAGGFVSYIDDFQVDDGGVFGEKVLHRFVFHAEKPGDATILLTLVRFGKVDVGAVAVPYEVHVEEPVTDKIQPVLAQDEPTVIKVVAGTDFNIDLEETPSTGFTWTLYDDSFIAGGFLSYVDDFQYDDGGVIGEKVLHRFVFHAERAGDATILLTLARFGKVDVGAVAVPYEVHVEEPVTDKIQPVLAQDEPTVIEVLVGQDFNIDLEETPTSGFIWTFYDESFLDGGFLQYIDDYQLDDHGGVGGTVTHRFTFHAENIGDATILLTLVRFGKVEVGAVPVPYEIHIIDLGH